MHSWSKSGTNVSFVFVEIITMIEKEMHGFTILGGEYINGVERFLDFLA